MYKRQHDLTTKFIQHYEIVDWVDGEPVNVGGAQNWTPEMKITLKDEDGSKLVLERGSNDPTSAAYRDRTITLDGKVIAKGAVSQGDRSDDDIRNGNKKGTETYLLPWIWDSQTGEKVKYFLTHSKTFLTDIQFNWMIDGVLLLVMFAEIWVIHASFA